MKGVLAVFALALFLTALSTQADTTTVDVSATTCYSCFNTVNSIDLQSVFTIQIATGNFFDAGIDDFIQGTEEEVIAISGTLNGFPLTLALRLVATARGSPQVISSSEPRTFTLMAISLG